MYVWLKLLAFGFAFLDREGFVTGHGTVSTTGASPTTTAPSTAGLTSTVPSSTIGTTQLPSCDEKLGKISVTYTYVNETKFSATLRNDTNVLCKDENCAKELTDLKECSHKTINVSDSCDPPKMVELDVPPGPEKFKLHNCTDPQQANTSICLEWRAETFDCDSSKVSYRFNCTTGGSQPILWGKRCQLYNLSAKTNYTCVTEILYDNVPFFKRTEYVETDFGPPEKLTGVSCDNATADKTLVTWINPSSYFHGVFLCYKEDTQGSEECRTVKDTSKNQAEVPNLKPYKNYTVSLYAYVNGTALRNGTACQCPFQTQAARKFFALMFLS